MEKIDLKMENQMSSEEIEKGKVLRQKETGKVRGNKLGWKRERTGMAREEAL